jgi:outer membrane receptor protein involved in Fe transport
MRAPLVAVVTTEPRGFNVYKIHSKPSLRSALLLGAASAAVISLSAPAFGQESTETVVVTGSRIPQQGLYSSSPVTSVGQQEFKLEGTTNVVDMLNSLPSVTIDQSSSFDNGATGTATVNLRDLGTVRTLVLVDGSRLMPGDPQDPVADLNTVPAALVDHVEVLTGGASAVYGSDAVAGVVNFIMRKDFEGVEFNGQYGFNQHDNSSAYAEGLFNSAGFTNPLTGAGYSAPTGSIIDGQNHEFSIVMGTNSADGKGNVTGWMGYQDQMGVTQGARDTSACTLAEHTSTSRICSGSVTFGYYVDLDSAVAGSGTQYSFFNTGTGAVGSGKFAGFTGAPNEYFNFAKYQLLERPDTRYNGGFNAHYEVNKQFDVYSSFMFTDDKTTAQLGPSGIFYGTGPVSGAYNVNCTNPYLTAQEAATVCGQITPGAPYAGGGTYFAHYGPLGPFGNGYDVGNNGAANLTPGQAAILIARRNVEGNPRTYTREHESYRLKVGAKGDLGNDWSYDAYAQLGVTSFNEADGGQLLKSNVINALQATSTSACSNSLATGCVPLDVFDGFGGITPAMEKYITAPSLTQGYTKEEVISGSITGDFGAWGGQSPWAKNPIGVSIGSEYREESLGITPDVAGQQGLLIGGSESPPISGRYDVAEAFTELRVPLVQNMPFVEDFSLKGAYRYSSYNLAGKTDTYEYGAEWQPIDDVRFRASYNRAVRAPNVLELFTPQILGLFTANDPCSPKGFPSATVIHNCETAPGKANVPASAIGSVLLNCPASQCVALLGGNPTLKPELSDTRTLGAVFTPTFLDGFTATVDYFDIHITKTISSIPESTVFAQCYGPSATAGSQAQFCPLVHRTPSTHSIAINSNVPATSGYVAAGQNNTGGEGTRGFDFEANYLFDLDNVNVSNAGSLSFNLIGTLLDSLNHTPIEGLPAPNKYDCAGLYGNTCGNPTPKWRHKLRATWQSPWDFSLSVDWRYFGLVSLDSNQKSQKLLYNGKIDHVDAQIPAMSWFDLVGDWTVREGVDLRAGVNNVFDQAAPITAKNPSASNTYPGVYDTLGRYMFASVTIKY